MTEELLLNPALIGVIGVIIGSGLSIFGSVISQIILSRKEQKQWENKQAAEDRAWTRNEQKKENEYLREIYQNSLRSLSLLIVLENQDDEKSKEAQKIDIIDDIHKWVTMLLLRHSSSELGDALDTFTSRPSEYSATNLKVEIIKLSNNEGGFYLKELKDSPANSKKILGPDMLDADTRSIHITIDDDYRRQKLIEGIEISSSYTFKLKLSEMSNSQREKLAESFFNTYKTIPSAFNLYIPVHNKGGDKIEIRGKIWQASINPNCTNAQSIISSWENDFEKYRKEAEISLRAQNNLKAQNK